MSREGPLDIFSMATGWRCPTISSSALALTRNANIRDQVRAVGSGAALGTDASHLPRLHVRQCCQDRIDERQKILHLVRMRSNHDHSEREGAEIVLSLELSVHGEESIGATARALQELAIQRPGPSQPLNSHHVVAYQCRDQIVR